MASLNGKKPLGPASIPAWALVDSKHVTAKHICFILNEFIKEEQFPASGKLADVTPIFKKGDPLLPENYRPISVTNAMAKIFEKLLLNQMNDYLSREKLQSPFQFGFRKGYSTQDAILFGTESWRMHLDAKQNVHVALLDLSKAFNSLNHDILNIKLSELGFNEQSRNILMNFTSHRLQRVKVNGICSDWLECDRGVPQGTVLGPLLFSLYVNDINSILPDGCHIVQYADDTCLFVSCGTDVESNRVLSDAMDRIISYFESHELTLNVSKTDYVIIHSRRTHTPSYRLTCRGNEVSNKRSCKYLGVAIDEHLTFHGEINRILAKMATGIKTIMLIRNTLPLPARIQLLKSLVLSHMSYSSCVLSGISTTDLRRLDRQINWGLRACYYVGNRERMTHYRLRAGVLNADYQIKQAICIKFWSILNNHCMAFRHLPFPNLIFREHKRTLKISLNNAGKTCYLQNSFLMVGVQQFNEMSICTKDVHSKQKFKKYATDFFQKSYENLPHDRILTGWNVLYIRQ